MLQTKNVSKDVFYFPTSTAKECSAQPPPFEGGKGDVLYRIIMQTCCGSASCGREHPP